MFDRHGGRNAERQEDSEDPRMTLQHVEYLDDVISETAGGIMIVLNNEKAVAEIQKLISGLSAGRSSILLTVLTDKWEVEIVCEKRYTLTPDVLSSLSKVPGVSEVREL